MCRLDWTEVAVSWEIDRFQNDRMQSPSLLAVYRQIAAALDGPIRRGLNIIGSESQGSRVPLVEGFSTNAQMSGLDNIRVEQGEAERAADVASVRLLLAGVFGCGAVHAGLDLMPPTMGAGADVLCEEFSDQSVNHPDCQGGVESSRRRIAGPAKLFHSEKVLIKYKKPLCESIRLVWPRRSRLVL